MPYRTLLLGLCLAWARCGGGDSPSAAASPAPSGRVAISIEQTGFVPNEIQAERNKPLTLVFTRKVEQTCVDKVVFPNEKIEKDLPVGQPVEVALAPAADTTFRCPMGHAIGRISVR